MRLQLQVHIACPYPCPCSPHQHSLLSTHARTHSLFLSFTPSFLPSLFIDLLCGSTTPSQRRLTFAPPTVASWREEDLTVFVPSFGIPPIFRRGWLELSQSFADPKLRLLVILFCFAIQVDNHNPAAWTRISSPTCDRPYLCKIISPRIPPREFHTTPQISEQSLLFRSEASRFSTLNVRRKTV